MGAIVDPATGLPFADAAGTAEAAATKPGVAAKAAGTASSWIGKGVDATKAAMQRVASMSFNPFAAAPEAAATITPTAEQLAARTAGMSAEQIAARAALEPTAAEAERYAARMAAQRVPGVVQGALRVGGNIVGGVVNAGRAVMPWLTGAGGAMLAPILETGNTIRDVTTLAGDEYGRGLVLPRIAEGIGRVAASTAGAATGGAGGAAAADLAAVGAVEGGNRLLGGTSASSAANEIRADRAAGRVGANGQLAPVYVDADVMAKASAARAANAAKAAQPAEESIVPARTVGAGAGTGVGNNQFLRADTLQAMLMDRYSPQNLAVLTGADREQALTGAAGLQHNLATQAAQQLSAEAAWQHNITAERGQDTALLPHLPELKMQEAIQHAVATGDMPRAAQLAQLRHPVTSDYSYHAPAIPGEPGIIVDKRTGQQQLVDVSKEAMATATARRKNAQKVSSNSTATTGVRG